MSWRTNKLVIIIRTMTRIFGINRLLAGFLQSKSYENRFHEAMLGAIKAGDCVWDVGANVGYYSSQFSQSAGPQGKVYAFEPSPQNLKKLDQAVSALANVVVLPYALGNTESTGYLQQGEDDLGATSRLLTGVSKPGFGQTEVEMTTGDRLIAMGRAKIPNWIKIDTEGYEWEVIQGLRETLGQERLRGLFVEIHFKLLAERSLSSAPAAIENLLKESGFSLKWTDASHLFAIRIGVK